MTPDERQQVIDAIKEHFPDELLQLDQWVLWRLVKRKGDPKPTKQPHSITGSLASSTDPRTWASFDAAAQRFKRGGYDGLGFVFSDNDPYLGVDLDGHCTDGKLDAWALDAVNRLDSYTELSPSGTGVHVIVRGVMPGGRGRKDGALGLEMYDRGRFFTVTGRPLDDRGWLTIPERQAAVDWLYAQLSRKEATSTVMTPPGALDDDALLQRMFASKNGAAIRRLWDGDISAYNGDDSAADLALCNHLAFWTGNDAARIDRLFRQSGLMRDKWDRNARAGETYGQGTIREAIEGTRETYSGGSVSQETPNQDASRVAAAFVDGRHDLGNAEFCYRLHGQRFAYTEGLGWLHYTGTHWEREAAEARVQSAIVDALKERCKLALERHDLDLLRAATPSAKHTRDALFHFKHMATRTIGEFDTARHLLNCKNGVVNLRTGEIVSHSPSDRFTYCVDTDYVPGERCELWENLLLDWFNGDHDTILYLQRAFGYTITGDNREECLFYMHGPGRSGKGTMINTVAGLLGAPLAQAVQFDAFVGDGDTQNFRLAPLRAARMVTASESKKGERLNEKIIKHVTGADPIQVAFKYGQPFSYVPAFKLWLMSNDLPRGDVDDDAFWGRVRLFTLTKSHLGEEDNTLKATLAQADHRRGVLAWLVYGSMRWYDRGLSTPAKIRQNAQTAREEQDMVLRWMRECCTVRDGAEATSTELYLSYSAWCADNGIDRAKLSKAGLVTKLKIKGFPNRGTRRGLSPVTLVSGLTVNT